MLKPSRSTNFAAWLADAIDDNLLGPTERASADDHLEHMQGSKAELKGDN